MFSNLRKENGLLNAMPKKPLRFGQFELPFEAATTHFCFIGATGSGKTILIRLLMQSAIRDIVGEGFGHRALVYDSKRDMIPTLRGMFNEDERDERVITLNPFDSRGYAWDMAQDITSQAHALELSMILIPENPNASQPFFADAARHLLEAVITAFIKTRGKNWTFRDVLNALWKRRNLIAVLKSCPLTQDLVELYFDHAETSKNIMSTIATKLKAYRIIAALWEVALTEGKRISLNKWLNGKKEKILIFGNDHTNRTATNAINQVIFKRITQLILDQEDDRTKNKRTWVFLDEFVAAGKLDGAVELAREGRSKGASLVIGFQDVNGLRAVYGKELAEEIIGQCSNIAILRLQSPDTTEWASRLFGKYRISEKIKSKTEGHSPQGWNQSVTTQEQKKEYEAFLSSEFMLMPPTNDRNGLTGVFYSPFPPFEGVYQDKIPPEILFGNKHKGADGLLWDLDKEKGIERRDETDQDLKDWTQKEIASLGLNFENEEDNSNIEMNSFGKKSTKKVQMTQSAINELERKIQEAR